MKIFCIGFQKTGTTSLETALIMLGFSVGRPEKKLLPAIQAGNLDAVWKIADRFDALQDNPWPLLYRQLDHHYPGSKFILTLRDPDAWIKSMINHCGKKRNAMRQWVYGHGSPIGNEQVYLDRLQRHNTEVAKYFKDRPDDLLTMNLTTGDGWETLCPFLEVAAVDAPFPHSNKHSNSLSAKLRKMLGIQKHKAHRPPSANITSEHSRK